MLVFDYCGIGFSDGVILLVKVCVDVLVIYDFVMKKVVGWLVYVVGWLFGLVFVSYVVVSWLIVVGLVLFDLMVVVDVLFVNIVWVLYWLVDVVVSIKDGICNVEELCWYYGLLLVVYGLVDEVIFIIEGCVDFDVVVFIDKVFVLVVGKGYVVVIWLLEVDNVMVVFFVKYVLIGSVMY